MRQRRLDPTVVVKEREYDRERYKNDPEGERARRAAYRLIEHPFTRKLKRAHWWEENSGARNEARMARYARKCSAEPAWRDRKKIERIYEYAKFLTIVTGEDHHVDHRIPLKSDVVCGLHVEHNLQVITAAANQRKSAHFAEEN